jgi:hypothetical protein
MFISEIRISKSETNSKFEITECQKEYLLIVKFLCFEFSISDFIYYKKYNASL